MSSKKKQRLVDAENSANSNISAGVGGHDLAALQQQPPRISQFDSLVCAWISWMR